MLGSAFEQVLDAFGQFEVGLNIGAVLDGVGTVKVPEAMTTRTGIKFHSKVEWAQAQSTWWVHQVWAQEFYRSRNQAAHEGHVQTPDDQWAWTAFEHLLVAAFVFPLLVKAMPAKEGHFVIGDDDAVRFRAVDKLLATTEWATREDNTPRWHGVLSDVADQAHSQKVISFLLEKHPDFFDVQPETES